MKFKIENFDIDIIEKLNIDFILNKIQQNKNNYETFTELVTKVVDDTINTNYTPSPTTVINLEETRKMCCEKNYWQLDEIIKSIINKTLILYLNLPNSIAQDFHYSKDKALMDMEGLIDFYDNYLDNEIQEICRVIKYILSKIGYNIELTNDGNLLTIVKKICNLQMENHDIIQELDNIITSYNLSNKLQDLALTSKIIKLVFVYDFYVKNLTSNKIINKPKTM